MSDLLFCHQIFLSDQVRQKKLNDEKILVHHKVDELTRLLSCDVSFPLRPRARGSTIGTLK